MCAWRTLACSIWTVWFLSLALAAPTSAQLPVNAVCFEISEAFVDSAAASEAGAGGYSPIILRRNMDITVNAIISAAAPVDEEDDRVPRNAMDGRYVLRLPGATCSHSAECFIGGAPRFLVGEGSAGNRPALESPTATAAPPSPTPTELPAIAVSAPPATDKVHAPSPNPTLSPITPVFTPASSPRPSPTPLPPVTPLSILTTSRWLIMLLVGLAVFTATYGLQVAVWRRKH